MTARTSGHAARDGSRERLSDVAELLSDKRRRYAVWALDTYRTPMALVDLADEVVRRELNAHPTDVPDTRYRVYVQLYHRHLPKLGDANVVTFYPNENLVELGPRSEAFKPYLDSADFDDEPTDH